MYLNIFGQWRWMKILSISGGIITVLWYSGLSIYFLTLAIPHGPPTRSPAGGHLQSMVAVPGAAVGLGIDLVILIVPLAAVSNLQMARNKRLKIIIVFSTGILLV